MAHSKLHLTSNHIALLALTLSVLSSAFGVYQWWSGGKADRIRAAIDLSDRYIDQAVSADLLREEVQSGTTGTASLDPVKRQDARIEYISFLVNHGFVNSDYLAQRAVCDIIKAADPQTNPEAYTFKNNHPKGCVADSDAK